MVLPLDNPGLRKETVKRDDYFVGEKDPLPYNVEYALARIVHQEVEMHAAVEQQKKNLIACPDYTVQAAFKAIDARHTRYISFDILAGFLRRRGTGAQTEDVVAFMRRADRDMDCKLTFQEFADFLQPGDPKLRPGPTPNGTTPAKTPTKRSKSTVRGSAAATANVNKTFVAARKTPSRVLSSGKRAPSASAEKRRPARENS